MMVLKIIGLLAVLLCPPFLIATNAAAPEQTGQDSHVVIGILEELDLVKLTGKVKTDLQKTVAFTIKNSDLFKRLSVGERIAVVLDNRGQVVKVMETTVPELPPPVK
jgi:hypothetical protein